MAAPRQLSLELLPEAIQALILRDGSCCCWCGRRLGIVITDATVDHVIPRSRGGLNTLANYLLACQSCNSRRKSKKAESWLQACRERGLDVQEETVAAAIARADRMLVVKASKLSSRERKARKRLAE